jgi:hypothetical protein
MIVSGRTSPAGRGHVRLDERFGVVVIEGDEED